MHDLSSNVCIVGARLTPTFFTRIGAQAQQTYIFISKCFNTDNFHLSQPMFR